MGIYFCSIPPPTLPARPSTPPQKCTIAIKHTSRLWADPVPGVRCSHNELGGLLLQSKLPASGTVALKKTTFFKESNETEYAIRCCSMKAWFMPSVCGWQRSQGQRLAVTECNRSDAWKNMFALSEKETPSYALLPTTLETNVSEM